MQQEILAEVKYPPHVSEDAKSLIRSLLDGNEHSRLGATPALLFALKAHPFFTGIDWSRLSVRHMIPPFVPDQKPLAETAEYPNYEALVQAYIAQKEEESNNDAPTLDWDKPPPKQDQKYFDSWDFVALHTLKIELGISNELEQADTNFKVRQLMGDPGSSVNEVNVLRQHSSASGRSSPVKKLRTSLGL
jgi:serine/threonine protein kinase